MTQLTLAELYDSPTRSLIRTSRNNSQVQIHSPSQDTQDSTIGILQWNAAQLNQLKHTELTLLSERVDADVIMLCELHRVDNQRIPNRIKNFEDCHYTIVAGTKGLATYVKKGIIWRALQDLSECANAFGRNAIAQATEIYMHQGPPLLLWNVYIHPECRKSIREKFWNNIIAISEDYEQMFIAGDINEEVSPSSSYSSIFCPSFSDMTDPSKHKIVLLNDESITRLQLKHDGNHEMSAIDASFASPGVIGLVQN